MEDVFLFYIPDLSSKLETIKEMKEWSWEPKGGWVREGENVKKKVVVIIDLNPIRTYIQSFCRKSS